MKDSEVLFRAADLEEQVGTTIGKFKCDNGGVCIMGAIGSVKFDDPFWARKEPDSLDDSGSRASADPTVIALAQGLADRGIHNDEPINKYNAFSRVYSWHDAESTPKMLATVRKIATELQAKGL